MKRDIWENRNVIVFLSINKVGGLAFNPNGVIVGHNGKVLRFGYDYIVVEGDEPNLLKIYQGRADGETMLLHQIEFHD